KNIAAFLLIITGSMALGSMYSGYINNPAIPVTSDNVILTLMMGLFIFSGYYSYNYLTNGKGKILIALFLNLFLFLLTTFAFTQGYNIQTQKWFSVHEILNLILTLVLTIQLIVVKLQKK
ncbi:MAG: hypothetical protein RMJ53_10895, partial [Chitinophagales bacterium]|nr:hypothetical protein [Chitinophagales bacterium]